MLLALEVLKAIEICSRIGLIIVIEVDRAVILTLRGYLVFHKGRQ